MIEKLHDLIGGRDVISAAIRVFYDRVLEDETLRPFFASTDMARLRAGQGMFVSMLLGGNVVYMGRDIGAAHVESRSRGLTDAHFNTFLAHFRAALDQVGIDPDKAERVMLLLETKRSTILGAGTT